MAVTDKQIAECVAYYRRLVDKRPASPPESLAQTTRSGLQKIIVRAGAKRRSDGQLGHSRTRSLRRGSAPTRA